MKNVEPSFAAIRREALLAYAALANRNPIIFPSDFLEIKQQSMEDPNIITLLFEPL